MNVGLSKEQTHMPTFQNIRPVNQIYVYVCSTEKQQFAYVIDRKSVQYFVSLKLGTVRDLSLSIMSNVAHMISSRKLQEWPRVSRICPWKLNTKITSCLLTMEARRILELSRCEISLNITKNKRTLFWFYVISRVVSERC